MGAGEGRSFWVFWMMVFLFYDLSNQEHPLRRLNLQVLQGFVPAFHFFLF
uniref:Uncharacterized protein n=1 Tax=Rhizophora mucronata TaxID=61149 RepID=A0A2P2Q7R2_RHIMU